MSTLAMGDTGPEVEDLQQQLTSLGYGTDGIDGDFGSKTQDAVEAFQAAYGMEITGEVDDAVWAAMVAAPAWQAVEPIVDWAADMLGFGPTANELVDLCLSQVNDPYSNDNDFGLDDENPPHFDCSGLIEWACAQLNVELPGWSEGQIEHCEKKGHRTVEDAKNIPGAVLYWDNPREGMNHIALSIGDGEHMVDANGTTDRVSVRRISDGPPFGRAGLIPGIGYPEGS